MSGVYISYPFCAQKCTYCNFASGVLPAAVERDYLGALRGEITSHRWEWTPDTVYLGGGTPSRLAPESLAAMLEAVPGRPWKEATIEAAPGGITREVAAAWRGVGINRVSLGVQSFVERELRSTGRRHTAAAVADELAVLREAGLESINVDLIAGLPWQTEASWSESLDWIERLAPPHVSVYMLEVDEDSRLGGELIQLGARYGAREVPDDDQIAAFYSTAVERLAGMGIPRYEISNFARPGWESLHNLKYWRREPYAGFGADAHGFDGRMRHQNAEEARDYIARLERDGTARAESTAADEDSERFFVGLRLSEGVEPRPGEWQRWAEVIGRFENDGLLERAGSRVRLTDAGVLLSNEVFQEFLSQ